MRHSLAIGILFVWIAVSSATNAYACKCSVDGHGRNSWENAQELFDRSAVIFEGEPIEFELRWSLLQAKTGDLIPTETFFHPYADNDPHMVITFRVARGYKGNLGTEVQLHTGLGGGDCAATYQVGLKYLVYAGGPDLDHLCVSMCSPGGWIEDPEVATDLPFLRKQRPTPADLRRILRWSEAGWDKQDAQRKRNYEESRKTFQATTGKICGKLTPPKRKKDSDYLGSIAFLSALGYSPLPAFDTSIRDDGSFCSPNLGPGKYYLYFAHGDEHGNVAAYYPGVTSVAKAIPIEVRAGKTEENIVFKVADQSSYSVRGFIFADEKPDLSNTQSTEISVALIRTDGDRRVWPSGKAIFFLPKTAYFKIENVPPGHYIPYLSVPREGWSSRKVEVDVTSHMKFISLDLVHKK